MPPRSTLFTRRDVLLFPLLSAAWSSAGARNARRPLVLAGVAVIDGKTALQPSRTVVITDDRIAAVGAAGAVPIAPDATVLDARGQYLIPGLWDMHGHLSYTFGVMDEARKPSIPVAGHLPRAVSAAEASDAGQRTLEHVDTLFDGRLPSDGTAEQMAAAIAKFRVEEAPALFERFARNGTWFTPTLGVSTFPYLTKLAALAGGRAADDRHASAHSMKLTRDVLTKYREELTPAFVGRYERTFDEYLKLVALMHKNGVPLLAGSDFATSVIRPGFDLHEELRLLVTAGLSPMEALRTATSNPARCLGQADLGTVEAGHRADLVLLDENPLADIRNTQKVRAVIRDGRVLGRESLEALLVSAESAG